MQQFVFWEDLWGSNGVILATEFPRIASFSKSNTISMQEVMQVENLDDIFHLPLSQQAFEELDQIQDSLQHDRYDQEEEDNWLTVGVTSCKFYRHVYDIVQAHPFYKILWKSRCIPRIKFFAWLVLVDHLNTKKVLTRRHIHVHNDDLCVLCNTRAEETIDHIFFDCPFSRSCWNSMNINWNSSLSLLDRFYEARQIHNLQFFTEITLIAAWEIWNIRNDKVFHNINPSFVRWSTNFKSQAYSHSVRFKDDLLSAFCFWLDAFS